MLVDIPAGTDLFETGGTTAARRAFLAHWGYDDSPTGTNGSDGGPADWEDYVTDGYKNVLENMIVEMIPEPATMAILSLGGMAVLARRRIRK